VVCVYYRLPSTARSTDKASFFQLQEAACSQALILLGSSTPLTSAEKLTHRAVGNPEDSWTAFRITS